MGTLCTLSKSHIRYNYKKFDPVRSNVAIGFQLYYTKKKIVTRKIVWFYKVISISSKFTLYKELQGQTENIKRVFSALKSGQCIVLLLGYGPHSFKLLNIVEWSIYLTHLNC